MRRYYLHTRHHGIFYAELLDPQTGCKLTARSTGTKDRDEAMLKVASWLQTGIPTGRKRKPRPLEIATSLDGILKSIKKTELNSDDALRIVSVLKERNLIDFTIVKAGSGTVLLTEFLKNFWTYDTSPYIREKLAHRYSIGKRHCYDMLTRINKYWLPAFKDKTLNSITKADLKIFSLTLAEKGLAPGSINKTMIAGKTALGWAYQEGMISMNPADYSASPVKAGSGGY
jgi:hypothetical protein